MLFCPSFRVFVEALDVLLEALAIDPPHSASKIQPRPVSLYRGMASPRWRGYVFPRLAGNWAIVAREFAQQAPSANQPYSSVDWRVRQGQEQEFVERWKLLAEWMIDHPLGVRSMVLLRDQEDSRLFRSVLSWSTIEFAREFRLFDKGQLLYEECQELCEAVESRYYLTAARLYG